ncbi:ubiquitin carboxyl-terminal hydrolase 37-like [Centropristis striata]|uniref:ubiquitin carboxyl-terminal hydrolase 37-like n=1 Tax=Centropristis striata TaxID=184440 RepID=UPI0027E17288|nr:ubiquitin carboxyl-terminal hydrolase 37-like [Centropristis striata]
MFLSNTSDTNLTDQSTKSNESAKKTCWLRRLFKCCKKRTRVSPCAAAPEHQKTFQRSYRKTPEETNEEIKQSSLPCQDIDVQSVTELEILDENLLSAKFPEPEVIEVLPEEQFNSSRPETPKETIKQQKLSSLSSKDQVEPFIAQQGDSCSVNGQPRKHKNQLLLPEIHDDCFLAEQAIIEALIQEEVKERVKNNPKSVVHFSDGDKRSSFGFPNIGMSCYMNSSLQSLLTLENFVRDISRQEEVWNSVPEARLLRSFMAIRDARASTDSKRRLMCSFKEVVSVQAPEFRDGQQKDAHEFLTTVLDQMRSLSPVLQDIAAFNNRRYTCPVENHLVFKLENTRTCKRCGVESKRQEVFTNLSLDLVPGGTVDDMLQEYLKEMELEYRCECGGKISGQRLAFETLPRVLILHLKRFRFTSNYQMVKVHDPVMLDRDLVVSSKLGGGCYSLVSSVSHLGTSGTSGHYICDGIHPDDCPDEPADHWLTYNDSEVTETTGAAVCEQRRKSAYILIYERQV